MIKRLKKLQVMNLDACFEEVIFRPKPKLGWIRTVRQSLSMPLSFPANKLGISIQSIARLEKNEVDESITLKSLRNLAESFGCELHYIIVPKEGSFKKKIENRAYEKAKEVVEEVNKTMLLEGQKITNPEFSIKLLAEEFIENVSKELWGEVEVRNEKFARKNKNSKIPKKGRMLSDNL